jgi:hypothetical protein
LTLNQAEFNQDQAEFNQDQAEFNQDQTWLTSQTFERPMFASVRLRVAKFNLTLVGVGFRFSTQPMVNYGER